MEIIGDDKKLRALYSEARTADRAVTPSFTSVWHRAQAQSLRPRRAFNLSIALVTALLLLTLGSLAVWSMFATRNSEKREAVNNPPMPAGSAPAGAATPKKANSEGEVKIANKERETPTALPVHRLAKPRMRRAAMQPEAPTIASNTTIETWQSPTAGLLSSPTDGLFKSMPQLNENANEMKSFLPGRSNDKEK